MKENIILYILISLCLYMIWLGWTGQKRMSKFIQQHDPDWKPKGQIMQILWSFFKYKG